jgi:murein DD-endopeptidase MepM/ murein hydrolase activator NlpD
MKPSILWPVVGKYPISFSFGEAPEWYTKYFGYPHNGIDIACPIGTPVIAVDAGNVSFADDIPDSDGKGLILKHEWGISLYWHLSELSATLGGACDKGALIAKSGNTGYVTGPHLHFAIKVNGDEPAGMRGWTDPVKYIEGDVSTPIPTLPIQKTYIVGFGDTLWKIADKFYNNGTEWRRIYEANKDKIKNPNVIYPLQKLLIP